jgi:trans-aconitate 2-methyltransferase
VAGAAQYYAWLAPAARSVDVWTTEYLQVLPVRADGEHPVVAWMRGTALLPFVEALPESRREVFVAEYAERIALAYPRQADGCVLFPFRRRFLVAVRAGG